jgi:hypothetical protein
VKYISGWSWNLNWANLPVGTNLAIDDNVIIIEFASALNSSENSVLIPANSIRDTAGNVNQNEYSKQNIYTDYNMAKVSSDGGSITRNGRWLTLYFDDIVVDKTLVAGLSSLRNHISVSTDGMNYENLSEADTVVIQDRRLQIIFHEPIQAGLVWIKIEQGALSRPYLKVSNAEIMEVIRYNYPELTGVMYSNAPTEFQFEDNAAWRSKIREILVIDDDTDVSRSLSSSEYTLTAGKLTIHEGAFENNKYYDIEILAEGYHAWGAEGMAVKTNEAIYMTAPIISQSGGITASIHALNVAGYYNYYTIGTQSVVFQLMDGNTPVSIVAANSRIEAGTYTATFNVTDAAAKNYTVRAFIVSKYNTDATNVGVNMATVVTQEQLDLKQLDLESNNYYN